MTALTIDRPGQPRLDAHTWPAGPVHPSPQARTATPPIFGPPAGTPSPEPTIRDTKPTQHPSAQDPSWNGSAATKELTEPSTPASLFDPFLALAADVLDDTEENRKANENRLRQLTRGACDACRLGACETCTARGSKALHADGECMCGVDKDGGERGFGLTLEHPTVAQLAGLVQMMKCDSNVTVGLGLPKPPKERGKPCCFEHAAEANLRGMLRQHPLGPWIKAPARKGVGDKQAARLLAVIGDPYLGPDGEPRTVSQLRAYCGHGDPGRRKFKGMTQDDLFRLGNPVAKSRLWLISCACLKAQGHYADVYYARKTATEGRVHDRECVRCGPSGRPALPGSPWSDAHRHADALRILGKEFLRDLWTEAKRLHEAR